MAHDIDWASASCSVNEKKWIIIHETNKPKARTNRTCLQVNVIVSFDIKVRIVQKEYSLEILQPASTVPV